MYQAECPTGRLSALKWDELLLPCSWVGLVLGGTDGLRVCVLWQCTKVRIKSSTHPV